MKEILNNLISGNSMMPYIILFALVFYVLYRIFLFWWDLHKKKNELKHEMDEYINGLIDEKIEPIIANLSLSNNRIADLNKLRLPTKLIAIETKLEILTSNVDAGFKRIEEDIRSFHRR